MHQRAEYGIASHARYKHGSKASASESWLARIIPQEWMAASNGDEEDENEDEGDENGKNGREMPRWISDMAEAQQEFRESDELIDKLKGDFFQDRIFVFTPKGDVIDLPSGSTPVDFAYHVHSDIGDRMAGAKINGKLGSLDTKLQNGDIVEIMTSPKSKPTQKWLEYAQTIVARRHIRQFLNQEE
jgi:GTP pyrophosphokinase